MKINLRQLSKEDLKQKVLIAVDAITATEEDKFGLKVEYDEDGMRITIGLEDKEDGEQQ